MTFLSLQFDFVYITGDIPAHDVWEITREEAVRGEMREVGGGGGKEEMRGGGGVANPMT